MFSMGWSLTGVPFTSKIRSPMCNDIRSLLMSSLKKQRTHIANSSINNAKSLHIKHPVVSRILGPESTHTYVHSFIHSLVFSLRGWVGRNQSPVMWPVWLWHTAYLKKNTLSRNSKMSSFVSINRYITYKKKKPIPCLLNLQITDIHFQYWRIYSPWTAHK